MKKGRCFRHPFHVMWKIFRFRCLPVRRDIGFRSFWCGDILAFEAFGAEIYWLSKPSFCVAKNSEKDNISELVVEEIQAVILYFGCFDQCVVSLVVAPGFQGILEPRFHTWIDGFTQFGFSAVGDR